MAPANRRDRDLSERSERLRRAISELRGVRGVVVEAAGDEIADVRVLVVPERTSEAVTAEIIRLAADLLPRFDPARLQILRPTIESSPGRRKLASLSIDRSDTGITARVTLERSGDVLVGEAFGAEPVSTSSHHVVITAVLKAIRPLLDSSIELEDHDLIAMGVGRVAYVSLSSSGQTFSGSAVEKRGIADAFARATLQAVNRSLGETDEGQDRR